VLEEALETMRSYPGLSSFVRSELGGQDKDREHHLLDLRKMLHEKFKSALRILEDFGSPPSDAPTTCRCSDKTGHSLSPVFASQLREVTIPHE